MNSKFEHWKQVTEQWRQSGQTQKEFCKEHEIKFTTLTYWLGKIKKAERSDSPVKDLVCISMPASLDTTPGIILEIDNRYRITLPSEFSTESLKQILAVIG